MTITSRYETDYSSGLAKRFAGLAADYMNDPEAAKSISARVPLENLFRILEMYRYDAFDDENRRGVLALEAFGAPIPARTSPVKWHLPILKALDAAFKAVFPTEPKEDAVTRLQEGLRQLSGTGHIDEPLARQVKGFLKTFEASI